MTTRTVTKAVAAFALEEATRDGWTLKEHIKTTRLDTVSCSTPIPTESSGYTSVTLHMRQEAAVVKEVLFLVEKDWEVVEREQTLANTAADLQVALNKLKNEYDAQLVVATKATAAEERERALRVAARNDANDALEKVRGLETQLLKIKAAIGEDRYKEILTR